MKVENKLILNEKEWNSVETLGSGNNIHSVIKERYVVYPIKEKITMIYNRQEYDIQIQCLI
jgi:hypothetical protein